MTDGPLASRLDLGGKIALVTGASGGLGRHFALTLARAGASVALAARRADQVAQAAAEIEASGGRALPVPMDVTDETSVARALADIADRLGVPAVIVNNSGVTTTRAALDLDVEDWDRIFDTTARGAFVVARAAARRMIEEGLGGSIINIASILGLRVAGQVAPYAASKAALVHLTRALALEWARHNIRVNAIAPGYTRRRATSKPSAAPLSNRASIRRTHRPMWRIGAEVAAHGMTVRGEASL